MRYQESLVDKYFTAKRCKQVNNIVNLQH